MLTVNTLFELQTAIKVWRLARESIAFVPTMGNLHAGHLQLVNVAKTKADRVIVSIFVNPTQFGINEDFDSYPRTEQEDKKSLKTAGADLLFLPPNTEIYTPDTQTIVSVTGISNRYCGASRPGHFDGVATIVCKLFNMVQPTIAVFGLKDFQQLTVIRIMVRDLNIPVQIIGVETVREPSGLAMSSRNGYLTAEEKAIAPLLYQSLINARDTILAKYLPYSKIEQQALGFLQQAGFQPDYFSICRRSDLDNARQEDTDLVLLTAARLGKTRLIDNICFRKSLE